MTGLRAPKDESKEPLRPRERESRNETGKKQEKGEKEVTLVRSHTQYLARPFLPHLPVSPCTQLTVQTLFSVVVRAREINIVDETHVHTHTHIYNLPPPQILILHVHAQHALIINVYCFMSCSNSHVRRRYSTLILIPSLRYQEGNIYVTQC